MKPHESATMSTAWKFLSALKVLCFPFEFWNKMCNKIVFETHFIDIILWERVRELALIYWVIMDTKKCCSLSLCVSFSLSLSGSHPYPWLTWNLLCSPGWPQTQKIYPPVIPSSGIKHMCHHLFKFILSGSCGKQYSIWMNSKQPKY